MADFPAITHTTLVSLFSNIASAIRAKKGTSAEIIADDFPSEIMSIPSGGITPTGNINITDTNVTDVTNYATAQVVDTNLVASNIKEGVNILGILGTFAGGGSLPTSISKIDGGSFTFASDTTGSSYTITHNLGEIPKGYYIWAEENDDYEAYGQITLISALASVRVVQDTTTINLGGWYAHLTRRTGGDTTAFANSVRQSEQANLATSNYIKWNSTSKYKANCTYKWLAWA